MAKMIMVCQQHGKQCDEKGYSLKVGNVTHIFCCEKGSLQSIEDFNEHLKGNLKPKKS